MVKVTIDGRTVEVPAGTLVTDAARAAEVHVPIFCSHSKLPPLGACRICVVEVEGQRALQSACTYPLTGTLNRRAFDEALEQSIRAAARDTDALSLLMLDVDHFKRFNDTNELSGVQIKYAEFVDDKQDAPHEVRRKGGMVGPV